MRKIRKKTAVLIAIALALVFGGAAGAFAITASGMIESPDYKADFYLNHLQVHLLENGKDVCGGQNKLGQEDKVSGDLVQYLGYSRDGDTEKLGSVEPGKLYKEVISAKNGQDIPIYLRMTVKKYWVEVDEQNSDENADATSVAGEKDPALSPDKIHLMYEGKSYNSGSWFINESESTDEQTTYYYKEQLGPGSETDPLFDSLVIDSKLLTREKLSEETNEETGVTTIKYKYQYDGYAFMIKADVQAVQTHNANDAIHSQWGVYDITEDSGKLKSAK